MRDIFTVFHHARYKNKLQQEGHFILIYKECVIHTHTHTDTCLNSVDGTARIAQLVCTLNTMQKQRHCFIVLCCHTQQKGKVCVCVCVCVCVYRLVRTPEEVKVWPSSRLSQQKHHTFIDTCHSIPVC